LATVWVSNADVEANQLSRQHLRMAKQNTIKRKIKKRKKTRNGEMRITDAVDDDDDRRCQAGEAAVLHYRPRRDDNVSSIQMTCRRRPTYDRLLAGVDIRSLPAAAAPQSVFSREISRRPQSVVKETSK